MDNLSEKLDTLNIGKIEENISFKKLTTYKVGGLAKVVAYPKNIPSLIELLRFLKQESIPFKVIGNGSKLCLLAAKKSLTGLEFASGIPGTVGGSVFMNAGAYKSDMGYVVREVKVLTPDLKVITLENKEMQFHYRTSFLQKHPDYICLEVIIKLEKGKKDAIEEVIKERRKRRLESQPLEYPSAGSVFRNPKGMYSGELIESLGLKGKKIGGAMVSEKL